MKKFKRFILFFSIAIVLYALSCIILVPKGADDVGAKSYFEGKGYLAEKNNTIEVVALGNSDLYSGFVPLEIYQKYGYTSFGTGVSKQTTENAYNTLKDIDSKQNIKYCILETDLVYDEGSIANFMRNAQKLQIVAAPFIFHSRWKDLKLRDFTTLPTKKNRYDYLKGYQIDTTRFPYEYRNYMDNKNTKPIKIPKNSMKYLHKIKKYCDEKNIKLLFVNFPSPYSWNLAKHNGIEEFATKNNINYIDYNMTPERINFDFSKDFRDNGNHLNIYGARKVTLDIAKELEKLETLKDYRNVNTRWNKDLERYLNRLKKLNVTFDEEL